MQEDPQIKLSDPEITKRENHLIDIFDLGLDGEDVIGYHGTSLESIEYLIENGHLPGATEDIILRRGDLYFYPRKKMFQEHHLAHTFFDSEAIEKTEEFASIIAQEHYLMKHLGLDMNDQSMRRLAKGMLLFDMEQEEAYEELGKMGFSPEQLDEALEQAEERSGIVLALDKKILQHFNPEDGDENEGDLKINCPDGLDYSYFSGLKPISDQEWDFFENLRKKDPAITEVI